MNKDQPWVIEPWHIRASLRKAGYHILNDSAIQLPKEKITGPDLTKQNKQFIVWVTINKTEKARVKCRIHHWSTDPVERLPYVFEHYRHKAESLFGQAKKETSKTE
jgi:large subunit ribosomal protein L9